MADDLERFLQQAAERLAEKVQRRNRREKPASPGQPPRSVRQSERARPVPDAELVDDIIDAEILEQPNPPELGPDPLSNIDTRPELAQEISLADERMAGHLQEVFDHGLTHLRDASAALGPANRKPGETEKSSALQRRDKEVSPLIGMLRHPDSLRAAFIASEIFTRKYF